MRDLFLPQALQYARLFQWCAGLMRLKSPLLLISLVFLLVPSMAQGAVEMRPIPSPPIIGAKSYFVVDGNTGYELSSLEPDKRLAPASLTKLMTAFTIFTSLSETQIALDDQVTVRDKAWRAHVSRTFIEPETRLHVQSLLPSMILQSGNDRHAPISLT